MFYASELEFFRRILRNMHIDTCIVTESRPLPEKMDRGLRDFLELDEDYRQMFSEPWNKLKTNTIYKITDSFFCSYISMVLPETEEKSVFVAGPYVKSEVTHQMLAEAAEKYSVPSHIISQIIKYFGNIPVITDEKYIMSLCSSFGETVWKGSSNFSFEHFTVLMDDKISDDIIHTFKAKSDDAMLSIQILEERYAAESEMMQAVSQGMTHKVEQIFNNAPSLVFEKRTDDPLRNMKNYLIISNTLLRKAAEYGSVHPFYIDGASSDFARRIELTKSTADATELMREMIRKYCALVKKHSMKNYSLPVQKVLTVIDSDLAADLSLRKLAAMLNINASYLSSLFKRETGKTLTDYVSQKRIDHAAYLLKTTSSQVQVIAQHCGIFDVNYFSKMFKKYTGRTPKEYREEA